MFDATKILGGLMEQRSAPSAGNRLNNALNRDGGPSGGNPLGQLLSQLGGNGTSRGGGGGGLGGLLSSLTGSGGNGGSGASGMLGGLADMARQAMSDPKQEVGRNNPVAVGGLGALAGTLLGGGRGAVGGGLLAVLGSLAYSALQAGDGGGAASKADPAEAAKAAAPATEEEVHHSATLVLRAMIQAAKADGQLDSREIERITGKLDEGGDDPEGREFVLREMGKPVDVEGLAQQARTPKESAEIYAASFMAVEVDSQAEKDYLARLADALGLSKQTVDHIHQSLGVSV